jgi:dienelactone hydrolase
VIKQTITAATAIYIALQLGGLCHADTVQDPLAAGSKTPDDLPTLVAPTAADLATNLQASANDVNAELNIQASEFEWTDKERQRTVPVKIYWPAQAQLLGANAKAGAPVTKSPLIIFSHGLGGTRNGYSYLGRYLASHGYIAVHVQHAGSDRAVWTSNWLSMWGNLSNAASETNAIARAKDVSFAITQALAEPSIASYIDSERIAIAGHSYGANTALLIAGAKVQRNSGELNLRDPRVKAAVIISAPPFHGEGDMKQILGAISIPTLHVTGTEDVIRVPGYRSGYKDRLEVFESTSANAPANQPEKGKTLVVFKDATHSVFTDRQAGMSWAASASIKRATSEVSTMFLDSVFGLVSGEKVLNWISKNESLLVRKH